MSTLEKAIQLVRQGQKAEAQQILQSIIKSDPKNIQAWFWCVETFQTTEQRIQVLENCLRMNPGNPQVINALQRFQNQFSVESQKPIEQPSSLPRDSQPQTSSYSNSFDEKPQYFEKEIPASNYSSYMSESDSLKSSTPQQKTWEMDTSEYVDNSMLSKSKKPVKSYSTLDVWATVLTVQDEKVYEDILKDPEATLGRAFTWVAMAGLVNGLLFPLLLIINPQFSELASLPEFQNALGSYNTISFLFILTIITLVVSPISMVINLAITGGVQNLVAGFFGGMGNYTRTVYAISAFLAPVMILSSILTIIPYIGQCLVFPLAIYNIVLNVRALKASHSISTGAALGVMFSPTIILFIFFCLFFFLIGGTGLSQ